MSCGQCLPEDCIAPKGWVCKKCGDFFTTGEWKSLIEYFDIHGVTFHGKINSVKHQIDINTVQILKVLICESNNWDYTTTMEIIQLLDEIISRLSNDNKKTNSVNNSYKDGENHD